MWKLQNLSVTQILREINFGDFRSAKFAILTHLQALNFVFVNFFHFLTAEIYQINKIQSPEIAKKVVVEHLDSPKLFSRKI